jgi:Uma2 family endonuclease
MTALTSPLMLDLDEVHLTDEQFYQLCVHNPELTIERSAKGVLIVMSPVGGESGNREINFGGELYLWNKQSEMGVVFSSSTMFRLPGVGIDPPMPPGWSGLDGRLYPQSSAANFLPLRQILSSS